MSKVLLPSLLFFMVATAMPRDAMAVSTWDSEDEPCMRSFQHPEKAAIEYLAFCMRVWATFRSPGSIDQEDRNKAIPAFQRVYLEGGEQFRYDALLVLQSLQAPIPQLREGRGAGSAKKRRKKFVPLPCTSADRNRASRLNKKGVRLAKSGKTRAAHKHYVEAVQTCEAHVPATYNLAAASARLEETSEAIEYLQRLIDMGDDEALKKVGQARMDPDFDPARDDEDFRRMTGYRKIKLLNSVGEYGEEDVERIAKMLKRLKHPIGAEGSDKHQRKTPYIWYQSNSKVQVLLFKEIIDHPKTRLRPINWESDFDIIISWGVELKRDEYGDLRPRERRSATSSSDPEEVDRKMRDLERQQMQALRHPDKAANKANRVLDTPERTGRKVDTAIDRTDRTIKKVESVGKRLGL